MNALARPCSNVSLATEARVLCSFIVEPDLVPLLRDVEIQDFSDFRNRVVFMAIRALERRGEPVNVEAVCDEIEADDLENGKHQSEFAGAGYIGQILLRTQDYRSELLLEHDAWWLRELSNRRNA